VLDACGVDVRVAPGLVCCGMPAWEHGDLESLRRQAKKDLDVLTPYVEKGRQGAGRQSHLLDDAAPRVAALLAAEDRPRAEKLAAAVMDPCEYLWSIRNEPRFALPFKSTPVSVAYHAPCHLRRRPWASRAGI